VEAVAKYRAAYPTPLSADQKVDLLRHIASELHAGLLRKPDGTNCGGYSCDVICFSDVTLFDVLQDSDGAAIPAWNPTTNPRGYRCEMAASAGQPSPLPTQTLPAGTSIPALDLSPILARLEATDARIERVYADLTNQNRDNTATLKAAIDEPAWYSKLFGNKYVQLAIASGVTYFATHQVMK
jgi:hypothetical protein